MHKVGRQLTRTRNCKIAPAQPISALKELYIKARHVVQAEVDILVPFASFKEVFFGNV